MGCWQSVCGTEFAYKTVTNTAKIMGCRQTVYGTEFALKTATNLVKIMGCRQPVCGTEFCCIGRGNIENFLEKWLCCIGREHSYSCILHIQRRRYAFGKYSQLLVIYDNVLNRRFSKMLKMSTILPIETGEIWPYFAHFWQQFGAKIFKYAENVH